MTVDALWDVVVVIEWTQVRHHVYAAPLQVDRLIYCRRVGYSLTVLLETSALERASRQFTTQTHPLDCGRTFVCQDRRLLDIEDDVM